MSVISEYKDRIVNAPALGMLAWFSVSESDSTYDHATLTTQLADLGLEKFLPRPSHDADVFRRTFQNGQRRGKVPTEDPGVFENFLIRTVSDKDGKILRRIVVERVNAAGEKLDFTESMNIRFDIEWPERVIVEMIDPDEMNLTAWQLADELAGEYVASRNSVNSGAIRDLIRRVLLAAVGTSMSKGGGLYFVPIAHADLVASIEQLVPHLPGASFGSCPLIDDDKQRISVREAFEAQNIAKAEELTAELINLRRGAKAPGKRRMASLEVEINEVIARTIEHQQVLNDTLEASVTRGQILHGQFEALRDGATRAELAEILAEMDAEIGA
jgi:hypothetical protein